MKKFTGDPLDEKLLRIATRCIPELKDRKHLKPVYSDDVDFFETSVWSLEEALKAAYTLGKYGMCQNERR